MGVICGEDSVEGEGKGLIALRRVFGECGFVI